VQIGSLYQQKKKSSLYLYLDKYFLIDLSLKGTDLDIKQQQKIVSYVLLKLTVVIHACALNTFLRPFILF